MLISNHVISSVSATLYSNAMGISIILKGSNKSSLSSPFSKSNLFHYFLNVLTIVEINGPFQNLTDLEKNMFLVSNNNDFLLKTIQKCDRLGKMMFLKSNNNDFPLLLVPPMFWIPSQLEAVYR